MKKGIIFLCLVLCLCVLGGCKQRPNNESENQTETEFEDYLDSDNIDSPIITVDYVSEALIEQTPFETFYVSDNVFTGELLSFEYSDGFDFKSREGLISLNIEIDGVYKGEYTVGNIVSETYEYGYWNDIDNPSFWEIGQRYMFMMGIDKDLGNKEEIPEHIAKRGLPNSRFKVIKFHKDGKIELINNQKYKDDAWGRTGRTIETTYELFDFLFEIDLLLEYKSSFYADLLSKRMDYIDIDKISLDKRISALCEMAENVYYGEVVNVAIVDIGGDENDKNKDILYKIKVKVMTVYKGDLNSGDIIEDIVCRPINVLGYNRSYHYIPEITDYNQTRSFFISGGDLDYGYTLDYDSYSINTFSEEGRHLVLDSVKILHRNEYGAGPRIELLSADYCFLGDQESGYTPYCGFVYIRVADWYVKYVLKNSYSVNAVNYNSSLAENKGYCPDHLKHFYNDDLEPSAGIIKQYGFLVLKSEVKEGYTDLLFIVNDESLLMSYEEIKPLLDYQNQQ